MHIPLKTKDPGQVVRPSQDTYALYLLSHSLQWATETKSSQHQEDVWF